LSSLRAPQLKPHFDPLLLPGEGVLLLRENGAHALYGALYEQLIPLLDGSHSTDAIVELLSADYKKAQVYFALITLQARGYLCEAVSRLSPAEASFWAELEVDPEQACRLVEAARVEVIALGAVDSATVLEALRSNGIALTEIGEKSALTLVICDDYLNEEVVELINAFDNKAGVGCYCDHAVASCGLDLYSVVINLVVMHALPAGYVVKGLWNASWHHSGKPLYQRSSLELPAKRQLGCWRSLRRLK
tara:strand:+ start:212 stop:955 length:744 start_codon:yes stop_codon:yes gene_type:complete